MRVDELVTVHFAWILNKARFYYQDKCNAEDLASETIYKCLVSASQFDESKDFKPWALTIMHNTYLTSCKRKTCVRIESIGEKEVHHSPFMSDTIANIRQILTVIRECCRKSESIRCVMMYARGYCYSDIAEKYAIPVGTVKSRISFGRKMLRDMLEV